ncbi:Cytoplasmic dynein 2 heavy chain 1 [Labeo rohita]|uniref:Cytoplasmic dynein 2 heavy chain 1 n=1 Tax=Labeo rohita TaxID=84645 RepID=A0ABQ8M0S6_LABRO|nr:Cytoplasmic dynein 2 heavy chain 1 [Labeo rohita]
MPPGTDDPRKLFILNTAGNYFSLDTPGSLSTCHPLDNFLDDGNQFLLTVTRNKDELQFSNKLENMDGDGRVLLFFKPHPCVVSEENLHKSVLVSSMLESPISTLYQALRQVYSPVLLQDDKWSQSFDSKLQSLLTDLEVGLGSVLRHSHPKDSGKRSHSETDVSSIMAPLDEFGFWADVSRSGQQSRDRDRAAHFSELFATIEKDYSNLDSFSLVEVLDLIESTRETVDDVWKQNEHAPYPEPRMIRLMDVIGGALGRFVQRKLSALCLWEDPYFTVREGLKGGVAACEQWVAACEHLTGQVWKRYSPHPWSGEKHRPQGLQNLAQRLEEVVQVRSVCEKLQRLLSGGKQQVSAARVYQPFTGLNPIHYNPYTEPLWRAAVSQFDRLIAPAEQEAAGKLKTFIIDAQDRLRTDFESRCHGAPGEKTGPLVGRNLPEVVNNIVWVRQLLLKVEDSLKMAEALLSDLSGFRPLVRFCDELQEQMRSYEQEQFEDWTRDLLSGLSDPKSGISLQASNRVMELDHMDGKLKIQYSDRLVSLLREVRQLSALGFTIPAKIQQAANTADKFYRQAIILKQNPRSQSRDEGGKLQITWENPKELEQYIGKLQSAAERLSTENRKLRKWHTDFTDKVVNLMGVDLLRQQQRWKDGDMRAWRQHWNHQLYKALEHQYQVGLEALNKNLPEINIDLIFKQGRLQFRPAFEEVRAKYYREMKRFICIPNQFKGDWVVLGQVDVDVLVEKHLHSVQDWERNFKALKAKGKEAERLPSTEKVDCITVNCEPVRVAVDDLIQRLFDALLTSLRRSIQGHIQVIDSFVSGAMEMLSLRPESIDEIGEANVKHSQLQTQKPEILPQFQQAEEKNRLLRSVAGGGLDTISSLRAKWDKFELMMESHQLMIKEQVEMMKGNVESRVQVYLQDLQKFRARWDQLKPGHDIIESGDHETLQRCVQNIRDRRAEFDELENTRKKLMEDCEHFNLSPPEVSLASDTLRDLQECSEMSKTHMFEEFLFAWHDRLRKLEEHSSMSVKLQKEVDRYKSPPPASDSWREEVPDAGVYPSYGELVDLGVTFGLAVGLWMVPRGEADVDPQKMEETGPETRGELGSTVGNNVFRQTVDTKDPYVRGEHLSQEHWLDLFRLVSLPRGTTLERLQFRDLLRVADNIIDKALELKDLNSRAQAEVTIREALRELELWGAGACFTLTDYTDSQGGSLRVIKDWRDMVNQVGDNRCLLQSLKDSPYYLRFQDKVSLWETRLADLDEYLQNLNTIQRKWVYLEPIFGRGALPREQARFQRVDQDFRAIMSDVQRDSRVTSLTTRAGIRNSLVTILDQLQRCQKSLNEFLEEKRSAFPRFYFIGDDDLLEILGQATNPTVIHTHLKKLFAGISSVEFDQSFQSITAMKSLEGETVPLQNTISISNDVEVWLSALSTEMKNTLKHLLCECVNAGKNGNVDPTRFPSQILCLAEQIQFTADVENAIRQQNLHQLELELTAKLESYTSVDGNTDDTAVVQSLREAQIHSTDDWIWKKQLRFYLNTDQRCSIQMGNAPKLVHTPLTDKCYLTLTQAMKMGLGGNPYGPAGTGKTESVKALGGLFGRQVLVFNCDEGIDVKSMGRIFVGLVKCGAWGCFDEFNRLEEAVLSAVSMQIQAIQNSLKNHRTTCQLLNKEVELDPNSGVFITLNPAGKGYGGRQKLPDNLKQLFRPVAMTSPDNELIAEVILYSEGFKEGKALGRKLVAIFNLARELLTPQQHYDWGLRALKTVLRGCGSLLQLQRQSNNPLKESGLVVQALRLNTMSKLTFTDSSRFDALVKDVFPSVDFKDVEYEMLKSALLAVYEEARLEIIPSQLRQRMGVVVVGPSGAGKSTLWRMLRAALGKMSRVVKQYTMNPKAMPRQQLLGHIDMDTREWSDGVLTSSARQVVREPQEVSSWIICDGDIDPEWIESLNSVLDDNRLLTMPSGERIQFGPNVNFLFETHDLSCASPATISRMGMIFLSDEDTDVGSLVKSWLKREDEDNRMNLENWLNDYFHRALDWVLKQSDFVVDTSLVGTVLNGLSHLRGVRERGQFVVGLIRGLGGNLTLKCRQEFAKEVLSWARESPPDPRKPLDTYYNPASGRLCAYELQRGEGVSADDLNNPHNLPVIHTPDTQRGLDLFTPWLSSNHRQPFLLVGPEGCGKGMLLRCAFSQLRSTQVAVVHCSAQTSSRHVLQKLSHTCLVISSNTGRVYRPKDCERLVLYLKDINLPKPDKWGTSNLIAFLQQVLTYQGFYDENLEWVGLENIQIVASMSAGGAVGRHTLTEDPPACQLIGAGVRAGKSALDSVLEAVAYEARRLFRDRIVSSKDLNVFDNILSSGRSPGQPLPPHGKSLGRLNASDLSEIIHKGIVLYGRDNRELDILLFPEVLDYMSRVVRCCWLVVAASAVVRLPAWSATCTGASLFTPKTSRSYSLKHFKSDLKTVMQSAAVDGQQVVLLLEDHQFVHLSFLEMVNSLLSSGEVPGLYSTEELEPLLSSLKDQASQDGFTGPVLNYFSHRVQQNLHVVLIMDCTNEHFTINCESNPALYRKCSVQWMEGWSDSSMKKIPEMLLSRMEEDEKDGDKQKKKKKSASVHAELYRSFLAIHESCREFGATPSQYLSFLQVYQSIYSSKRKELTHKQQHLQAGVAKLNEAKALVDELKRRAAEQSSLLKTKQAEADAALQEITTSMQNASDQKTEMEKIKERMAHEVSKIEERKKKIDEELREVQPLVDEAKQAVGNIKPESLSEIRSLRMPPDVIRDILEGVLRLMGIFDTSWVSMKSFLAKRGVREDIATFDARSITHEIRQSVEELLHRNKASFDPKNAKRASAAAAPLAAWVKANVQYSHVLEKIQPLETEHAGLMENLRKTENRKNRLEKELNSVGEKVLELKEKFQCRTTEAAKLESEVSRAQETISAAEKLLQQLDGEHTRWTAQVDEISEELDTLPKRAQLSAAFITYLPAAPEDQRRSSLDHWMSSSGLQKFDLRHFLCSESEQLIWKSEGLPSDDLSMENALVILQSASCPFLIDPSSRATEWLRTHLKAHRLEVINQQDANFMTVLELAVRFGKTLIIQEMDGVEPVLYPLLRRDLIAQGPRYVVQIGDKVIDYNEDFRLFLATRNPSPFIPPDAKSVITEVNFTTTRAGLRGQLLALTIQQEKPELESEKTKLLQQEEEKKIQLAQLEESLLETLATAQGNILENKELIESLNQTKASSALIHLSLTESHRLQTSLDQERDAYLPLAETASKMYFVITDLSKINNMYRFSLASFLRLFHRALQTEQESESTDVRISTLESRLKNMVYEYICRSLFKEWDVFTGLIVGDMVRKTDSQKSLREQFPSWIDQERLMAVALLKSTFPVLYQSLCLNDSDLWLTFSRSSCCDQEIPPPIAKKISLFQQVLVVQALRPDRLQSAMATFASQALGKFRERRHTHTHKDRTQSYACIIYLTADSHSLSSVCVELFSGA